MLSALLTVVLAACGRPAQVLEAEEEGIYVDVSELQYQVQYSRQLNPAAADDQPYLRGLERDLSADEAWFAIFLRATNPSERPQPTATEFEVLDSQENTFHPIPLGPDSPYQWPLREPVLVPPGKQFPPLGSPAAEDSAGGALLLFKVPIANLQNRPFELIIKGPPTDPVEAKITLDV